MLTIKCSPGVIDPSCTEERKEVERHESLSADTTEVQCLVGSEWESNCHYCRCSDVGIAECLKQDTCDKGVFAEPVLCKPNTTFQRDCNTCICLENGLGLCTLEFCRRSGSIDSVPEILIADTELNDKDEASQPFKTEIVVPNQNHYDIGGLDLEHNFVILKRSICKPLEEFMRDCNPCKCASDGLSYSCTHNECLETDVGKEDKDKEVEVFMQSEGQDHIERHSVCRASNTFYIGCNTCRCNSLGTDYTCTNKPCPLPADVELFHELKEIKPAVPYQGDFKTEKEYKAAKLSVVTSYTLLLYNYVMAYSSDYYFGPKSFVASQCHTMKSSKNKTKSRVCEANRMFIKDCNTCWCNEDGTSYYCTRRVCVPLLPEDQPDIGGIPAENLRVIKKECRPNEVFELECNMCRCNPDGKSYACTRRACEEPIDDKKNATLSRKVRSLTTEPPKACKPGQEFRMDCNKCLCDNKGQDFSCTRHDCNALNNNHHASAFTGVRSKRGSVFDRGCNVCKCTDNGQFATCSLKRCKTETEHAPESDQGFRCNPGEQFKRDCNDCTCSADGRMEPVRQCVPTMLVRGPSHVCICTSEGIFHCRPKKFEEDEGLNNQSTEDCEPNYLYRQNNLFCACSANGTWESKNCEDHFHYLRPRKRIYNYHLKTNIACTPNDLFLIDCNLCRCSSKGFIDVTLCTKRLCGRGHKVDDCAYGDMLRTENEMCRCSDINYYIDRLCIKVLKDPVQKIPAKEISKLDDIEKTVCNSEVVYKVNCNTCICKDGNLVCTDTPCEHKKSTKVPLRAKKTNEIKSLPRLKSMNAVCEPGKRYRYKCNVCSCTKDGSPSCTTMICLENYVLDMKSLRGLLSTADVAIARKLPEIKYGMKCVQGQTYKMACNTCRCGNKNNLDNCRRCYCRANRTPTCSNEDACKQPIVARDLKPEDVRSPIKDKEFMNLPELPHTASPCVPGTTYKIDCNVCLCDEFQNLMCDKLLCISFADMHKAEAIKKSGLPCNNKDFTENMVLQSKCVECTCNGTTYCVAKDNCISEAESLQRAHGSRRSFDINSGQCLPNHVYK
ncbi:hypothetical protein HW555_003245 [Spodoptera exigua]|uniref:Pacifastin domain-containing protein n=1 Tax=Spodoptera exigua TaxID=7107 RepID=A0A835L9F2_SPOEX|nr:hypothetical protein HW555_003245 [Spodoptera exigua]